MLLEDRESVKGHPNPKTSFAALGALAAVCLVYLQTMPPGLVGVGRGLWDSQETQAVGVTWGYLHPPGYPLQSLLANVLAHSIGSLPGVEPAWAVTLLSVLAMVLATGFVYHLAYRLTNSYVAAMLAMVVFAVSPGPWRTAITAEVYALNLALWGLVFWLTVRAADASAPRFDFWLGLALGLAAGHHRTAFLLIPAALLYLGIRRRWLMSWTRLLLGVILSAGVYLYLPLAHVWLSPMTPGEATSWWGFWELVSARAWSVFFGLPSSLGQLASGLELIYDALDAQLGIAGSFFGMVGIGWLVWRQSNRLALFTLLGLPILGLLAFGFVYQVPDVATMLGPLVMMLCLGLGGLVAGGWKLATRFWELTLGKRRLQPSILNPQSLLLGHQLFAIALVLVVGGSLLAGNYTAVDESWDQRGQEVVAELACELSGTPGEVWLTAESGFAGPLVTYIAERIERQLVWASPWGEWDYLAALEEGRRVFLVKDKPGVWQPPDALTRLAAPGRYLVPTGSPDLLELADASLPPRAERSFVSLDRPFDSAILLRGYSLRRCQAEEEQILRLTLLWEARSEPGQDWRVKAHLIGSDGGLIAQADSPHPARGARPTTSWQPGHLIRDVHDFSLTPGTDLGAAHMIIGLYQVVGDEFPSLAEVEIQIAQ
jgi:hypothetical protein